MKEEHIRVFEEGEEAKQRRQARRNINRKGGDKKTSLRLQVGVRVHARIEKKNAVKFYPGFISKISKNGAIDVECEDGVVEHGLTQEDLMQGLEEGQLVEAKRPHKVQLQCTGLCWNASGSAIAASYGRTDISGVFACA